METKSSFRATTNVPEGEYPRQLVGGYWMGSRKGLNGGETKKIALLENDHNSSSAYPK